MPRRRMILLTNDDGFFSHGINSLYEELSKRSDVYVVAPDREQSASSHSLTLDRPLRIHKIDKNRYTTDGTPTDCVMLGLHLLFRKRRPDMIVSGINHGGNMGEDVTYSGTIAAAIEGAILRIPSIAISMAHYEPGMSMVRAAKFLARFIEDYGSLKLDPSIFLNINFPPDNGRAYRKSEFTRQGVRFYKDVVVRKTDPRGKAYYWIGGQATWKMTRGTDFEAVERRVVSITPMKLEFTDESALSKLKQS